MIERIFSDGSSLLFTPLTLLSLMFRVIVLFRGWLYSCGLFRSYSVPVRVASIGNLTVGGTGKTPMVIYLVQRLSDMGVNCAVVSRGYGRKRGGQVVVSAGSGCCATPETAGEEPCMIAERLSVPVVVDTDRYAACKKAMTYNPDLILLDDAFQHLRMQRDVDILLVDASNPFGNGHMIPRGPLREPVAAIARASAVVITRAEQVDTAIIETLKQSIGAIAPEVHIHVAEFAPGPVELNGESMPVSCLHGRRVVAFAGIGNPGAFQHDLEIIGCNIVCFKRFLDHHSYMDHELEEVINTAERSGAIVVTTEKDFIKISRRFRKKIFMLRNGISALSDEEMLLEQMTLPKKKSAETGIGSSC